MKNKKMPVDVAASTGEEKGYSVGCSSNALDCDYITRTGYITRERIHQLVDLIFDFKYSKAYPHYDVHLMWADFLDITICSEYGEGGYGNIDPYYGGKYNPRLEDAERKIRKIMEDYDGQNT